MLESLCRFSKNLMFGQHKSLPSPSSPPIILSPSHSCAPRPSLLSPAPAGRRSDRMWTRAVEVVSHCTSTRDKVTLAHKFLAYLNYSVRSLCRLKSATCLIIEYLQLDLRLMLIFVCNSQTIHAKIDTVKSA